MSAVLIRAFAALLLCLPVAAGAQADPAERARAALALLDEARGQLDAAESGRDRVRALTATLSAYEAGLAALRDSLRQVTAEEKEMARALEAREQEIAGLIGALQRVGGTGSPVFLLHPGGPTGTVRAGMLLAEVTPVLSAQADRVRQEYEELQALQNVQEDALARLGSGLAEVQAARTALSEAIANRTDLPQAFTADPVREAILISSAETLESFANGLDRIAENGVPIVPVRDAPARGTLALPVRGQIRYGADQADAAGVVRPGILVETLPQALVTSPARATLRYVGPLLDFGQVVILEPQADVLFVFAGLETLYVRTGEMVDQGAPLGLMGASGHKSAASLSTDGDQAGAERTETLYIEVREENTPVDPSAWFRSDKDG